MEPVDAAAAIEEIVTDALAHFDAERLWPSHSREDGQPDGMANAADAADHSVPLPRSRFIDGTTSLRALADGLNVREIPAPRGGAWSSVQVMRVMQRAGM